MIYEYSAFFPACIFIISFPILYPICTPCRCVMNLSLLKCNDLFSVLPPSGNWGVTTAVSYRLRFFFKFVIKKEKNKDWQREKKI